MIPTASAALTLQPDFVSHTVSMPGRVAAGVEDADADSNKERQPYLKRLIAMVNRVITAQSHDLDSSRLTLSGHFRSINLQKLTPGRTVLVLFVRADLSDRFPRLSGIHERGCYEEETVEALHTIVAADGSQQQ